MPQRGVRSVHQGHGKAECLRILRRLSAFLDDELPTDICKVIRRHMGACEHCEQFVASLRQTVTLCRHTSYQQLSHTAKARLRTHILRAVGRI